MTDVREQGRVQQNVESKRIDDDVRATPGKGGGVDFDHQWRPSTGGNWSNGPIDLPKGSGEHKLEFTLNDTSGKNLEFYGDAGSAMWVNVDSCPQTGKAHDDKKQIHDKTVASKKKLTLKDVNDEKCDLHYALRFKGDPWTDPATGKSYPPYEYDPEIKNGGRV